MSWVGWDLVLSAMLPWKNQSINFTVLPFLSYLDELIYTSSAVVTQPRVGITVICCAPPEVRDTIQYQHITVHYATKPTPSLGGTRSYLRCTATFGDTSDLALAVTELLVCDDVVLLSVWRPLCRARWREGSYSSTVQHRSQPCAIILACSFT